VKLFVLPHVQGYLQILNTICYRTKKNEEWLTSETWKQIEERENIKLRMIKTKSIRMQEQLKAAYATKHKGVKRRARRDRIIFVDNLEHEAEQTASHGEMSNVYKITKQLCVNQHINHLV
jgi:hypothetical protein